MIDSEISAISAEGEQWRQIKDFSRYWISNLGRVYDIKLHKIARTDVEYDGYILVSMRNDKNEVKSKRVHRLVAEAFLPDWNPNWPWTVNHINGKKDDNSLDNLEMLTTSDNSRHYQTAECFEESRKSARAAISKKMKEKCSDPDYISEMSQRMKAVWSDSANREMYIQCLCQRHSDPDERKQISDKLKEVCSNPKYRKRMSDRQKENWGRIEYRQAVISKNQDRIWVHNNQSERWIHSHELASYLEQGYLEGRLLSSMRPTTAGKIRISRGSENKFVNPSELDSYLSSGWRLGKSKRQMVQCIETGEVFSSVEECASAFGATEDLIRSRCKGTATTFRKLKDLTFRFYEGEDPFKDIRN